MGNTIEIILNGGIKVKDGNYIIPAQYRDFIKELIKTPNLILTISGASEDKAQEFNDYPIDLKINVKLYGKFSHNKIIKLFYYFKNILFSFFRKYDDFTYIFYPGNLALVLFPGILFRKIKYALYLRGQIIYRNYFLNLLTRKIMEKAEFIIATGSATAKFAAKCNNNVEEVVPMMNVSKNDLFKRKSFALSSPIQVLFLSRIEKEKGINETIDAIAELINEGYDIVLDVVGGGTDTMIECLKEKLSLFKERVNIFGQITEKEKIHHMFKKADIFLFPTYHEGFPRVLYEAMTFSTPIITTDILGTRNVMIDGENCLKVKPKNKLSLKNTIIKMVKDEKLRRKIGENSYLFMQNKFNDIDGNSHAMQLIHKIENISQKNQM